MVKNFELRVKIKVTGQQHRHSIPQPGAARERQVVHRRLPVRCPSRRENNAMVYDERGRGIIAQNGQSVVVDPEGERWLAAERDPVAGRCRPVE
jgi:hypothetical protein